MDEARDAAFLRAESCCVVVMQPKEEAEEREGEGEDGCARSLGGSPRAKVAEKGSCSTVCIVAGVLCEGGAARAKAAEKGLCSAICSALSSKSSASIRNFAPKYTHVSHSPSRNTPSAARSYTNSPFALQNTMLVSTISSDVMVLPLKNVAL